MKALTPSIVVGLDLDVRAARACPARSSSVAAAPASATGFHSSPVVRLDVPVRAQRRADDLLHLRADGVGHRHALGGDFEGARRRFAPAPAAPSSRPPRRDKRAPATSGRSCAKLFSFEGSSPCVAGRLPAARRHYRKPRSIDASARRPGCANAVRRARERVADKLASFRNFKNSRCARHSPPPPIKPRPGMNRPGLRVREEKHIGSVDSARPCTLSPCGRGRDPRRRRGRVRGLLPPDALRTILMPQTTPSHGRHELASICFAAIIGGARSGSTLPLERSR